MRLYLNLEEMEGRWIAHLADWPGGFASAGSREAAVAAVAEAAPQFFDWLRRHGEQPPAAPFEFVVDEVHRAWVSGDDYEVNAFFAADRAPLSEAEVGDFAARLAASRADLLDACRGLSAEALAQQLPGERWPIGGILNHVATAENWYLSRLGLDNEAAWDMTDVLGKLMSVRAQLNEALRRMANKDITATPNGETWSPRKIIRRALWHELDHAVHIRQLRGRLPHRGDAK